MNRIDCIQNRMIVWAVCCLTCIAVHAEQFHPWDSGMLGAGETAELVGSRAYGEEPGEWKQTDGPAVNLSPRKHEASDLEDRAWAMLIQPGKYVFEYTPTGGKVIITVPEGRVPGVGNRRPEADTAEYIVGYVQQPVKLRALALRDSDDDLLFHSWQRVRRTNAESSIQQSMQLIHANTSVAVCIAAMPGTWKIHYTVSDGTLESRPVIVTVTIIERPDTLSAFRPEMPGGRFNISLGSGMLQDAISIAPRRHGMTLTTGADIGGSDSFRDFKLSIRLRKVRRRSIVNAISMQTGIPWRIAGTLSRSQKSGNLNSPDSHPVVMLQGDLEMLRGETKLKFFDFPLYGITVSNDVSDIQPLLLEALRDYRMAGMQLQHTFVQRSDGPHLTGALPETAVRRVEQLLSAIGRRPDRLPPPMAPSSEVQALRTHLEVTGIQLRFVKLPLDDALWKYAETMDISVLFDPDDLLDIQHTSSDTVAYPLVTMASKESMAALDFLEILAEKHSLQFDFHDDGIVVLWRNTRPLPDYQSLYEHSSIQVYPLREVMGMTGMSLEWIAYHIRHRVYPDHWGKSGALLQLAPSIGSLVVIHHTSVQQEVLRELFRLMREGPEIRMRAE